mmetsp:Transcript_4247/g.13307  ORF Transcript_4247/g.13307 Transcript_4247/m.13307 type:complete len:220 (-) Transcript_4247:87-746(-)
MCLSSETWCQWIIFCRVASGRDAAAAFIGTRRTSGNGSAWNAVGNTGRGSCAGGGVDAAAARAPGVGTRRCFLSGVGVAGTFERRPYSPSDRSCASERSDALECRSAVRASELPMDARDSSSARIAACCCRRRCRRRRSSSRSCSSCPEPVSKLADERNGRPSSSESAASSAREHEDAALESGGASSGHPARIRRTVRLPFSTRAERIEPRKPCASSAV